MIDLTSAQHALLKRIVDAGPKGMSTDDLPLGDTLGLALKDLIEIDGRQVTATGKGLAFLHRVTA